MEAVRIDDMFVVRTPLLRAPVTATATDSLALQATNPDEAIVGRIDYGDGFGGECVFIPSTPGATGEDEDDGFLATFVSLKDEGNSGEHEKRGCPTLRSSGHILSVIKSKHPRVVHGHISGIYI